MSWQISQKDGLYRIWSTIGGDWLTDWMDRKEALAFYHQEKMLELKRNIIKQYLLFPHFWVNYDSNNMNLIQDDQRSKAYIAWMGQLREKEYDTEAYCKFIDETYDKIMADLDEEQDQSRQKPGVAPVFPPDEEARQLILEVNENFKPPISTLRFKGVVLSLPPQIHPDYWLYRVQLHKDQYIVAFPKHHTVGIGFALEEDYDRNFAFTSKAEDIYNHIKCNKKYAEIPDNDCIEAIRFIQEEIRERLCGPVKDEEAQQR